jgi:hypothetical protein
MTFAALVRNASEAVDASLAGVLGFRVYARGRPTVAVAASATDTSLTVSNAKLFTDTDSIVVDVYGTPETRTISAIAGNVLTIDALVSAMDVGDVVHGPFHDFGYVGDFDRTNTLEELEMQAARNGKLVTFKKLTTSSQIDLSFSTQSVFSRFNVAMHTGGFVGDAVIGGGSAFIAIEAFSGSEVVILIVQESSEDAHNAFVAYYPRATILGSDEEGADGESESKLIYEVTVLEDEAYTIPIGVDAAQTPAPFGFRHAIPEANLTAMLDALTA